MKVTVSYLSSKYDFSTTLKKIEATSADAIHADLIDGKYVGTKNFEINELKEAFAISAKPIDIHLMTINPEDYISSLGKLEKVNILFFHPSTSINAIKCIELIKSMGKKAGIVINPTEDIKKFTSLFPLVDAVLLMSVEPGRGGQRFLRESLVNYELIKEVRKNYIFEFYVDGGINEETISYVLDADGIIVGSYVCNSDNFEIPVNVLRNGGML